MTDQNYHYKASNVLNPSNIGTSYRVINAPGFCSTDQATEIIEAKPNLTLLKNIDGITLYKK